MRINFKQEELISELMNFIKGRFPEVELLNITESSYDPETLWINVTAPEDEDRRIAMREFGNDKAADIFLNYGYYMLVMPTRIKTA